jgi:hypothetical protein
MKFTLVILGADGRAATNLRMNAGRLLAAFVLVAGALASALWVGWKVGELTALL